MINVKRFLIFGVLCLFLVSMMGGVLGAEADKKVVGSIKETLKKVSDFFGDDLKFDSVSEDLDGYKNWIYAILLGMIIYTIISQFFAGSGPFIRWGITGTITALAIIGIPTEVYGALEVQYGAMGSAILAIIPFFIILIFTMKTGSLMIAKGTWGFFFLYYMFFAWSKFDAAAEGAGWPYAVGVLGAAFMIYSIGLWREKFFSEELDAQIEIAEKKSKIRAAWKKQQEAEASAEAGLG